MPWVVHAIPNRIRWTNPKLAIAGWQQAPAGQLSKIADQHGFTQKNRRGEEISALRFVFQRLSFNVYMKAFTVLLSSSITLVDTL